MQPYHHYLEEYQHMNPGDISRHLEIPFDENARLFRVKFMERNYTVSHPDLEVHCLDEEDSQAVLCNDIHAKILLLRYNASRGTENSDSGNPSGIKRRNKTRRRRNTFRTEYSLAYFP